VVFLLALCASAPEALSTDIAPEIEVTYEPGKTVKQPLLISQTGGHVGMILQQYDFKLDPGRAQTVSYKIILNFDLHQDSNVKTILVDKDLNQTIAEGSIATAQTFKPTNPPYTLLVYARGVLLNTPKLVSLAEFPEEPQDPVKDCEQFVGCIGMGYFSAAPIPLPPTASMFLAGLGWLLIVRLRQSSSHRA
jgi:hypothetical protein